MSKIIINENELKVIINKVLNIITENKKKLNESKLNEPKLKNIIENVLNEWRANPGYDTWADLETGGGHSRGIQNRKNFTRKENLKNEKPAREIKTFNDFVKLITYFLDSQKDLEKLYKILLVRYREGVLSLNQLNMIGQIQDFKNTYISDKIMNFVQEEGIKTGYISKYGKKIVDDNDNKLQPR